MVGHALTVVPQGFDLSHQEILPEVGSTFRIERARRRGGGLDILPATGLHYRYPRRNRTDQGQPQSRHSPAHRLEALQGAPSGRVLLQQTQTLRRIALRCEKTLTAFMGFVHLARAMIRIR